MKILFVCTGNICRSYAAEMIAKQINKKHEYRSAGTVKKSGRCRAKMVKIVLEEMGYFAEGGQAKALTKDDIEWADIIYCMTSFHRNKILRGFIVDRTSKIKLFSCLDPLIDKFGIKIEDPYGKEKIVYENVLKRIERCVKCIR